MSARWAQTAARLLAPDTPRLEPARRALDERFRDEPFDLAAAFESLAARDLVAGAWAEPGRHALDPAAFMRRSAPEPAMALALAADPAGVETAEQLAREAHRRALPFLDRDDEFTPTASGDVVLVWRTIPRGLERLPITSRHLASLSFSLSEALGGLPDYSGAEDQLITRRVETATRAVTGRSSAQRGRAVKTPVADDAPSYRRHLWETDAPGQSLLYHLADAYRYRLACARDVAVLTRGEQRSLAGLRYRDLEDPYEPVLAIWSLGYVLAEVTHEQLVLWAPEP